MRGTWPAKTVGWALALSMAGLLSAAVALAADSGPRPGRCPQREPRIPPQDWALAKHTLAPAGANEIRLCRYSGLNDQPPLRLVHARLLDRTRLVGQLVRRFDGLPSGPSGPVACPADDGSEIVALASYPDGHEVRISVDVTGCQVVSNGSVNRTASGYGPHPKRGPRLLAELKQLVG